MKQINLNISLDEALTIASILDAVHTNLEIGAHQQSPLDPTASSALLATAKAHAALAEKIRKAIHDAYHGS